MVDSVQGRQAVAHGRALFSVLASLVVAGTAVGGDAIPQAAFDAWARYRDAIVTRGVTIEKKMVLNERKSSTDIYRWSAGGASLQTDFQQLVNNRGDVVGFVRNPDYAFHVAKEEPSAWSMQNLMIGEVDFKSPKSPLAILLSDAGMPALFGLLMYDVLLPEALNEGRIEVTSVREVKEDGVRSVEVKIGRGPNPGGRSSVKGGILTLAPDYAWMITKARLELAADGNGQEITGAWECDNTYSVDVSSVFGRETPAGSTSVVPAIIQSSRLVTAWDSMDAVRQDLAFTWKSEVPRESDFRLASYGLREPATLDEQWTRRAILMVLTILVIIACLVGILRRRQAESTGSAS
jgi:hypothetical protein